jgi:hypothetical protein
MKIQVSLLLSFILLAGFNLTAQDEKESKITVEITKEINGEKKTFKGEYENAEQMKADPNYQEFAGEEDNFNFLFDGDESEDAFFRLDQLDNLSKSFGFGFHLDDDDEGNSIFKHFGFDDEEGSSGFFHLDDMDLGEFKEHMKKLEIEMQGLMESLDDDGKNHVFVFTKTIKIVDVDGNEFGKKGEVSKSNKLELEDLSFFPNPSSDGRFKVRFRVPDEDEMNIKVYNIEGKEVFNRYFERFGGTYSESIDLSGQSEGIYLLEISQGNKRMTKKIVID